MADAVRVIGLDEKVRALRGYAADAQDMRAPLEVVGARTVLDAQAIVSVESGALRADIRTTVRDVELVVTAGAGVTGDYAGIENYGDPNTGRAGTGFLTSTDDEPATRAEVDKYLDTIHRRNDL